MFRCEEERKISGGAHMEENTSKDLTAPCFNSSKLKWVFYLLKTVVFSFTAASFKSGKINNITARSSGLFACEKITFEEPFSRGKQVKVFLSPGNSTNGAAVWVESEDHGQFRACIYEYSDGSNAAAELNWIALESAPSEHN